MLETLGTEQIEELPPVKERESLDEPRGASLSRAARRRLLIGSDPRTASYAASGNDAGPETLDEFVTGTWVRSHASHLAPRTRAVYSSTYDRHIASRLGGTPLREIDAEAVGAFQSDLVASKVGPHAMRKAMTLLGALLQRAAEGQRIPFNPQRVVRKTRLPLSPEVRPLAPVRVEAMRAAADPREATILSVLGYAGLRPGELRALRWRHVRERTLLIDAEKTGGAGPSGFWRLWRTTWRCGGQPVAIR